MILCNYNQIKAVMNAGGIPAGVRVLSALLYTFPFLKRYLATNSSIMTYDGALAYHDLLNASQLSIPTANPSPHLTLICLHPLTCSFH